MTLRLRRRVSHSIGIMIVPAICLAISVYFGYSGLMGPRGLIVRNTTEAELAVKQHELAQMQDERHALEHRIQLLNARALDRDMLDEVARTALSEARQGEVAIPRRPRDERH